MASTTYPTVCPRTGAPVCMCRQAVQAARADSFSTLQNLGGQPLSKALLYTPTLPVTSPVPGIVDYSLDPVTTRVKKCCKDVSQPDRFVSELYPLSADTVRDSRNISETFGTSSRFLGRDPVVYF